MKKNGKNDNTDDRRNDRRDGNHTNDSRSRDRRDKAVEAEALEKIMRAYNHARKVGEKFREAVKALDGGEGNANGRVRCCGVYVDRAQADKTAYGFSMRQEGLYMALRAFGYDVVRRYGTFVAVAQGAKPVPYRADNVPRRAEAPTASRRAHTGASARGLRRANRTGKKANKA